jgi:hypothetical protein
METTNIENTLEEAEVTDTFDRVKHLLDSNSIKYQYLEVQQSLYKARTCKNIRRSCYY